MKYTVTAKINAQNEEEIRNLLPKDSEILRIEMEKSTFHVHLSKGAFQWQMNFAVNDNNPNLDPVNTVLKKIGFSDLEYRKHNIQGIHKEKNVRLTIRYPVEGIVNSIEEDIEKMSKDMETFINSFMEHELCKKKKKK